MSSLRRGALLLVALAAGPAAGQTTGTLRFTRENAGVQTSGVNSSLTVVNTFDSNNIPGAAITGTGAGQTNGYTLLTSGGYTNNSGLGVVPTGIDTRTSYSALTPGFTVAKADLYGGAGGTGQYMIVGSYTGANPTATLSLSSTAYYFGVYLSAVDTNNRIDFYRNNVLVDTLDATRVLAGLPAGYFGNPDVPDAGSPNGRANPGEGYVFVNIYSDNKSAAAGFDRIVFRNLTGTPTTGLESDNHTFAFNTAVDVLLRPTETLIPVPEPAGLLAVAAVAGAVWRRRRRRA